MEDESGRETVNSINVSKFSSKPETKMEIFLARCKKCDIISLIFFSRVHATLQLALSVSRSVGRLVGQSVGHTSLFLWFYFFDLSAPAQIVWWPQTWPLPTCTWLRWPCIPPCFRSSCDAGSEEFHSDMVHWLVDKATYLVADGWCFHCNEINCW